MNDTSNDRQAQGAAAAPVARWTPTVTVAAVIAHADHPDRYLLVEEDTPEGLRLNNPAGHLEPGETPLEAVVREALEETACDFAPRHFLGAFMGRFQREASAERAAEDITYLRLAYAGTVGEPWPGRALDTPIVRTLWLSVDELRASRARHRSPLVWACIEAHQAGRLHPLDAVITDPTLRAPELKRVDRA
jgi:8-oxo-dGTP pyrophosphatase MutT (NUDIX family)